jgi:hypothetical protein
MFLRGEGEIEKERERCGVSNMIDGQCPDKTNDPVFYNYGG